MTAANILLEQTTGDLVADALLNFIDVVDVPLDTPQSEAVFRRSRELVGAMTAAQAIRLSAIIHALHGARLRQ